MSTYAWGHFGDKAPTKIFEPQQQQPPPDNIVNCLHASLELLNTQPQPALIDIGCALGRSTFELAERYNSLALGIDLNF